LEEQERIAAVHCFLYLSLPGNSLLHGDHLSDADEVLSSDDEDENDEEELVEQG